MGFLRNGILALCAFVVQLAATPVRAFEGEIYEDVYLAGEDCAFRVELTSYVGPGRSRIARVSLITQNDFFDIGGSFFWGGEIERSRDITPEALEESCGLSNVNNLVTYGADNTFEYDYRIGMSFEAVSNADGLTYAFEFGMTGSIDTQILNVRTRVSPNAPPVAVITNPDRVAAPGDIIILDHTASFDPDSAPAPLSVSWDVALYSPVEPYLPPGETLWRFVAPDLGSASSAHGFVTLTVSDGRYSDTESFPFSVFRSNAPPVANAGQDLAAASGDPVSLNGSGSSSGDQYQQVSYAWRQLSGPQATLTAENTATPDFMAPVITPLTTETLVFELTVDDGFETATDTVSVTVTGPPNTPPTANAGTDATVESASAVTLDASQSSDPDVGQTLTYQWSQTFGPTVTLTGESTVSPSFTAPTLFVGAPTERLVFEVAVSDGTDVDVAQVEILVRAPLNTQPTANAGSDFPAFQRTVVTMSSAASSPNDAGQSLTYEWTQIGGPMVNFVIDQPNMQFFAPPVAPGAPPVPLTFVLRVFDGFDWSAPDEVTVQIVADQNTAPIADAGPDQTVRTLDPVTLDGSASYDPDPTSGPLTFNWVQIAGPSVTLTGGNTSRPTFTAPYLANGFTAELEFELRVLDSYSQVTDTVTITVETDPNTPPTANAGPDQTGPAGGLVQLNGAGSSANDGGQPLTYSWTQVAGPAATITSGAATSAPEVTLPMIPPGNDQVVTFSLTVFDGVDTSVPDTVTITVTAPANIAPTADAGADGDAVAGVDVSLDGTGSNANNAGQTLTYTWTQTAGPTVSLRDADTARPTFTAPPEDQLVNGSLLLTFALTVNDGIESSTPDTVTVRILPPPNNRPTANAGPDQTVTSGVTVALNGAGSTDPDSDPLTYAWVQTVGPVVTLSDPSAPSPTFATPLLTYGDASVTLEFSLTVNDGTEASPPDTVTITVTAPGAGERPAALISGLPGSYDGTGSFTVAIAFSEPVSGFTAGDILVGNAGVTSLTGGPMAYVATLSPTAYPAPITISVPENVATDIEATGNTASQVATIQATTTEAASQAVAEALLQRGRALINSQPKLRQFLLPGGTNSFVASVTADRSTVGLTLGKDSPIWMALQGEWSKTGEDAQDYVHLAFGAHLMRGENLILGAMVQFDDTRTTSPTETFRGEGWLVGPYLVARAANQPLVFSASVLTGETRNSLTRDGLGTDRFDTRRTLVTAGVEGQFVTASGLILIPSFDLSHVRDKQGAYVDAASNPVPAQTITLTEASFGLGFEKGLRTRTGDVVLTGKLSGVFAQEDGGTTRTERFRGRIDLGADIAFSQTASLKLGGYFDGIGAKNYQAWGASLLLLLEF